MNHENGFHEHLLNFLVKMTKKYYVKV